MRRSSAASVPVSILGDASDPALASAANTIDRVLNAGPSLLPNKDSIKKATIERRIDDVGEAFYVRLFVRDNDQPSDEIIERYRDIADNVREELLTLPFREWPFVVFASLQITKRSDT